MKIMIKKTLTVLFAFLALGSISMACSDNNESYVLDVSSYPLKAFAVKVGDSYYHGRIDQETHRVEIGSIEDASVISGVTYTLCPDSATVSPNPMDFIGQWKKEQQLTVTSPEGEATTYTIVLTKLKQPQVGEVLFEDQFDTDGQPDPKKWVLCKKAGSDWNDEMSESYDQAFVKDGKLVLKAELVDGVYRAGGIKTEGKFDFTFGRVEVSARITSYPNGAFPAIWLMPKRAAYAGWPNCGEIDMMEHIKQEPHIHHTIHTHYTYDLKKLDPINTARVVCNFAEFNTYGLEWTPEELTFFVNGQKTFSYPNLHLEEEAELKQWPFTEESAFYLILNMGLGGNRPGSWPGAIDDANLPAVMEVDWVKVSKLTE